MICSTHIFKLDGNGLSCCRRQTLNTHLMIHYKKSREELLQHLQSTSTSTQSYSSSSSFNLTQPHTSQLLHKSIGSDMAILEIRTCLTFECINICFHISHLCSLL
ncbi:hypothetical protein PGTUg99_021199 [Puccinia graminis f. sp. tritici]|uniref:Uncharacterized protein n=1 Tax=Puccinia graminis f. sp. tritici TaxID=56615 RepID=A0A5B0S135_PUCGR|nr:hypothetical protein PGTUg99_021199 [Puccinia graminis f. sp. tritici]